MSFFTGFGVSALVYFSLNMAFPAPGKYTNFDEVDVSEGDKSQGSIVDDERDDDDSKKTSSSEANVHPV